MEETMNLTLGDAREMFFAIDTAIRLRDEVLSNPGSSIPTYNDTFPIPERWLEGLPLIDALLSRFSLVEMRELICNWVEDWDTERSWTTQYNRDEEQILTSTQLSYLSQFLESLFSEEGELYKAVEFGYEKEV